MKVIMILIVHANFLIMVEIVNQNKIYAKK